MRFIFTCGGTAGHVNPAVAVADKLKELAPGSEFLFVGAKGKMETELVPKEGYDIKAVTVDNLSRGKSAEALTHNIKSVCELPLAIAGAKKILREFKPDAVIGTGGYVCYPVIEAAHELHIPTAIHESNAYPGLTTRLVADKVDKVMVGLEESRSKYKHPENIILTGTPVRRGFSLETKENARSELGIPENMPLVVSVWGSLGAGHMNSIMTELIPIAAKERKFALIHAAGKMYYEGIVNKLAEKNLDLGGSCVDLREYIFDMPKVMAAADVIICRAGASTIAELTYMGKPVIMVPSPNVTNNHQEKNARVLEKAGGATVLLEGEFTAESFYETVLSLLSDKKRLEDMSKAMQSLAVPDAADVIAREILSICR